MVTITRTPGASDALKKAIAQISKRQVRVGWFEESRYPDGTPTAYVATIQEFGSPSNGIPARPFMRPTVADKTTEWKSALAAGAYQVMNGRLTVDQMLGQVGDVAVGNIRETIESIDTPALAPATIAARAAKRKSPGVSTKPLIDTGLMFQSVTHKVENV